jgi:hypothetical protein
METSFTSWRNWLIYFVFRGLSHETTIASFASVRKCFKRRVAAAARVARLHNTKDLDAERFIYLRLANGYGFDCKRCFVIRYP